jgi:hypothetical protein
MTSVLLPTLAIAASWVLFGVVLTGCGYLARTGLQRLFAREAGPDHPRPADMWIGLAVVVLYLLLWNDLAAVGWPVWLVPALAGLAGAALGAARLRGVPASRPSWVVIALVALATVALANQALAVAEDYDFGLYHLGAIHYAEHYSAIPGLANLQSRFGAGDGHLLFVAFLDHGPWAGAGPHLADGLLAAMLCVELGSRFLLRPIRGGLTSFTNRMALLLAPALVAVVVWRPDQRIASPNLDFAAFVLVVVGMLYLAEAVERGFRPPAVVAATASLAAASATRPLYWIATLFAIALALLAGRRSSSGALRAGALAGLIPVATGLAWMVRQSILSGYPLFPTTTFRLSVDWRVPLTVVNAQNDWDHAWARQPGLPPSAVLGSWHWLHAFWLQHVAENPDVAIPLLLLACLAPAFLLGKGRVSGRSQRTSPMLAVLVPSLVTLVGWFFIAPDPRFAWGPIWLVPVVLAAWAIPDVPGRPSPWLAVPAGLAVFLIVELALLSGGVSGWLVPGVILATLVAAAAGWGLHVGDRARFLALGVVVTALLAGVVAVSDIRGLDLRRATKGGSLGTPPNPTPSLIDITTATGLVVRKPAQGADQCWQAELCVPQLKVKALALRGATLADGFKSEHSTASANR